MTTPGLALVILEMATFALVADTVTDTLAEPWALIGPGAGILVVLGYAALALALAWWQLRRRDA